MADVRKILEEITAIQPDNFLVSKFQWITIFAKDHPFIIIKI